MQPDNPGSEPSRLRLLLEEANQKSSLKDRHIAKLENELEISRLENQRLHAKLGHTSDNASMPDRSAVTDELHTDRSIEDTSTRIFDRADIEELKRLHLAKDEYEERTNAQQQQVDSLKAELAVVFEELEAAHEYIQNLLKRNQQPSPTEPQDSVSSEDYDSEESDHQRLHHAKQTIHELDLFYKAQLLENSDTLEKYEKRIHELESANGLAEENKLLRRSFELLSAKFVELNHELTFYKETNLADDKLTKLQELVIEKDNQIEILRMKLLQFAEARKHAST
ncbi:hypothetical protein OGAPHI_002216 [Ogataea philodendri]|uniref:Uncharacterized protein n=1 Tax=Ogataea philodendri TaxID=1378263 RepID=A0A9P8PAK6_9ASCO|nr:uncharacterized protein OGAPHI_002216 [Ogataea philodendri]KAH3668462.1 hypothetical protein OGAPHI_002216 [Ogataea philodendri]